MIFQKVLNFKNTFNPEAEIELEIMNGGLVDLAPLFNRIINTYSELLNLDKKEFGEVQNKRVIKFKMHEFISGALGVHEVEKTINFVHNNLYVETDDNNMFFDKLRNISKYAKLYTYYSNSTYFILDPLSDNCSVGDLEKICKPKYQEGSNSGDIFFRHNINIVPANVNTYKDRVTTLPYKRRNIIGVIEKLRSRNAFLVDPYNTLNNLDYFQIISSYNLATDHLRIVPK